MDVDVISWILQLVNCHPPADTASAIDTLTPLATQLTLLSASDPAHSGHFIIVPERDHFKCEPHSLKDVENKVQLPALCAKGTFKKFY